jgi:hypothetical protein
VPDDIFFDHLANRRFPAGQFIRRPDQLDYLEEPDVFHDVFGHVPMLAHPVFADYMVAYGKGGQRALREFGKLKNLARLYWYTVEFGLIEKPEGLRIYGSGIVSSRAESIYAVESPSPNRIGFDLERVMRTDYRIDDFQESYFVISSSRNCSTKPIAISRRSTPAQPRTELQTRRRAAGRSRPHPRHAFLCRRQPRGGLKFVSAASPRFSSPVNEGRKRLCRFVVLPRAKASRSWRFPVSASTPYPASAPAAEPGIRRRRVQNRDRAARRSGHAHRAAR